MDLFLALVAALQGERPAPAPPRQRLVLTQDSWIAADDPGGRSFLEESKDFIDWLARHDFGALAMRGLVDARHGGVEAARGVAEYARSKGVALVVVLRPQGPGFAEIPGHPFHRDTQLKAAEAGRRPGEQGLCLARPENRDWMRRGLEWIVREVGADGVLLESHPDDPRCGCADCAVAAKPYSDFALMLPPAIERFREAKREPLVLFVAGYESRGKATEDVLAGLPEPALAVVPAQETPGPVPAGRRVVRAHLQGASSVHLRKLRPDRAPYQQQRAFCPLVASLHGSVAAHRREGDEGFLLAGGSPKSPDAELDYLAAAEFSKDPELSVDEFLKRHVARLYGAAAAGEVSALLLAQPEVHRQALPFWARRDGGWPEGSEAAAAAAAKALAGQLAKAKSALPGASPDGKRRLDAVIPILDEYRIVCEAAATGLRDKAKLAEIYERAGLPDDLYGYKSWK